MIETAGGFEAERLRADVSRYAGFGWHRSGWPGDVSTTDWVGERLSSLGYDVVFDAIELETLDRAEGSAQIDGGALDVALQWTPPAGQSRIQAPLVRADALNAVAGAIALAPDLAPVGAYWSNQGDDTVNRLAGAGARAMIVCVNAPNDSLFLYNRALRPRLPIPVLVASRLRLPQLLAAASSGLSCTVTLDVSSATLSARSIIASVGSGGQRIVVSTPLTGWFQCGAERGAGVALFLALAQHLRRLETPTTLIATTGHEIGHLGMDRAMQAFAPRPDQVRTWVHLGSSIAARGGFARTPSVFATSNLLGVARDEFSRIGMSVAEARSATPGETGTVIAAGQSRVIGFAASNPDFHTPLDDGRATDISLLSQVGATLTAALGV
ncbi:MAG: hypothetical protein DCF16_04620 [Alphaproteobacteria bacterium]|nr:MAG: hypothetical protein DCF16_04620 [Alphaproteobacteria bacterium]